MQKEAILKEVEELPPSLLEAVAIFVRFLKTKAGEEKLAAAALSETSLSKDWLSQEEDEAWRDL